MALLLSVFNQDHYLWPFPPLLQALDGTFKAMAVGLPTGTELLDAIPGADPVLLHDVSLAHVAQGPPALSRVQCASICTISPPPACD